MRIRLVPLCAVLPTIVRHGYQLAAATGENRRSIGQARAVLLAFLGGEPSDPTLIRNDAPADMCAADPNRLTRGECNEPAGRRKGSRMELCPRNASELGVPVTACKREPGCRSPGPRDYATKDTLVDLEGPRAYKAAYLGGQNGNFGSKLSAASARTALSGRCSQLSRNKFVFLETRH